jgi:site-specific recombinase XerD
MSQQGTKSRQDMETKCGAFIEWLGHDNMAAVTFADCRDWRDDMIAEGELSPASISNYLKAAKTLFTYGFDNEYITANHMARVKYSPGDGEERDDFTPQERARILIAARAASPHIYWLNWLYSFHGFRNGEVAVMVEERLTIAPLCSIPRLLTGGHHGTS